MHADIVAVGGDNARYMRAVAFKIEAPGLRNGTIVVEVPTAVDAPLELRMQTEYARVHHANANALPGKTLLVGLGCVDHAQAVLLAIFCCVEVFCFCLCEGQRRDGCQSNGYKACCGSCHCFWLLLV